MSISRGKFARKLRKLKNNPKDFFADSALLKAFVRPGSSTLPDVPVSSVAVDLETVDSYVSFGCEKKFIKFGEKNKSAPGLSVLLMLPCNFDGAGDLIGRLWGVKDFSPFKKECLHIGWFDPDGFGSEFYKKDVADVINRIDQVNKRLLDSIDFIFFVDAPSFIVEAFRLATVSTVVISIVTTARLVDFSIADAYIVQRDRVSFDAGIGRRIVRVESTNDFGQLVVAMRRLVQDGKPRDVDLLLPVFGEFEDVPGLINFNHFIYQGIIFFQSVEKMKCEPVFDSLIKDFSGRVEKILLIESIYLKYKTLCEYVENGGSPEFLIAACLKDGVLFDVRC